MKSRYFCENSVTENCPPFFPEYVIITEIGTRQEIVLFDGVDYSGRDRACIENKAVGVEMSYGIILLSNYLSLNDCETNGEMNVIFHPTSYSSSSP